jgi:hypothetical protein
MRKSAARAKAKTRITKMNIPSMGITSKEEKVGRNIKEIASKPIAMNRIYAMMALNVSIFIP